MITEKQIEEWWSNKRPMWSGVRVIIKDNIAFVYAKMTSKDTDKTVARLNILNCVNLDELNPFEYCG